MSYHQPLTIGLFGFGVVGEGIYHVLRQTPSLNATIKKVCIKHPEKKRDAPEDLFTTNYEELLNDPQINLIVELIDDADEAYKIVTTAFKRGKSVISANKKLIAEHLQELIALQAEHQVSFLYEAAVCGSIPVIRNLEEYFDNDLLQSINGIVNGSTNYILTRLSEGYTYPEALLEAQQKGFAESNPALDVEGYDPANKLTILLAHAYGIITEPSQLLRQGITKLHAKDAAYASEKGLKIKLVAQAKKLSDGKVAAFVLPQFVKADSQLFNVANEYNGVTIESKLADKQFFYGKGAGRYPTSSAVISDISAFGYRYQYEYKKLKRQDKSNLTHNYFLDVFVSFSAWTDVNKWDFEQVTEYHSTAERQYIRGIIHAEKLRAAEWFEDPSVSVILQPDGLIEKESLVAQSMKKVSLQLAGVTLA
ncbi:MAG TPA: homoserine dehydrogenase [Flavisolibacter sp.]|jgi:homoserine dehydrogenase|nr:homoserine dehydrogenase [Flavisolibacter sp.]